MIKSDLWIREMATKHGMIDPFLDYQEKKPGVISSGLSDSGYDVRLSDKYLILTDLHTNTIIDPLNFDRSMFTKWEGEFINIPPHTFVLGHSMETFRIPIGIKGVCEGKSTYARSGINVPVTPLEQGWEGVLTIEIINSSDRHVKVRSFMGIAQISFHEVEQSEKTYVDRGGQYQGQTGITLPGENTRRETRPRFQN